MIVTIGRRELIKLGGAVTAAVFLPRSAMAQSDTLYGMIEIGSKGVKVSAYRFTNDILDDDTAPGAGITRLAPTRVKGIGFTENTNIISGMPSNIEATAVKVEDAVQEFAKNGMTKTNMLVVASSGVVIPKMEMPLQELKKKIKQRTGLDLQTISVAQEAKLSFDWVVLSHRRDEVLLIDVGSGNTKGGYYQDLGTQGERFRDFSLPYGTASFSNMIKGQWPDDPVSRHATAVYRTDDLLGPNLARQIDSAPGLLNKRRIYLSGGIVWATAMLTRPAAMAEKGKWVRLSARHFSQLRNQIGSGNPYTVAIPPNLTPEKRDWVAKTIEQVKKTFSIDELAAGAAICDQMAGQLEFNSRAAIFFASFASDAWSSQYLYNHFAGATK